MSQRARLEALAAINHAFAALLCASTVHALAFRAGAARTDATPRAFPVRANCMMLERTADRARDPLHAKSIVLDDGSTRLSITVVDSCMLPRDLLDRAKSLAAARTSIRPDHMLVSATHTHAAPAAMGCLGTDAQDDYAADLPARIADSIVAAEARLEPARIGWAKVDDPDHTHNRRWILRPDKMRADPFGVVSQRAMMHPGYQNPDAITESGPVDPGLSVVSVQSASGKPIAVLANYSQHYFGSELLSADYFGAFSEKIRAGIGAGQDFVAIMSQGTSGDLMWMDYSRPKATISLDTYAGEVTARAMEAYHAIRYESRVDLAMAESRLTLNRRVPDQARLDWARGLLGRLANGKPTTIPEVYAREQILLHAGPTRELKLQAVRIGGLGIAALPNEVFALTGLKIKAQSPLPFQFTIELANGAEGYIPPPEQHRLGGYTTWAARTAGLEVGAEPRIVEETLRLLERVSGRKRRAPTPDREHVWSMDYMEAPASLKGDFALYLPGVSPTSRAVYFAGGHLETRFPTAGSWQVEGWFWPGIERTTVFGASVSLQPKTWHRLRLVSRAGKLTLHGDGGEMPVEPSIGAGPLRIGEGFEGKIDNVWAHH
jgi:hypothetical protein